MTFEELGGGAPPTTAGGGAASSITVSSFCTGGTCVGVRFRDGFVEVVDTKPSAASALTFTSAEWTAFVAGVKAGEFDPR